MKITVKLFASLARFSKGGLPGTPFELDVPLGTSINQLASQLGIPAEEAKVAFVNGLIRDMDSILQLGDELGIFPPIGGG